jgi:hypothetical protein
MTTKITVTDGALEAMLARRAHRADPAGLAEAVFAAIDETPRSRGPRLGVPAWWLPGRPSRGLAWILVAASLLLALLGSAFAGAGLLDRPRPPISLVPTAIGPRIDATWDRVLAVSADEAWATEKRGIWHFVDGIWTGPLRPPGWIERANGWALAPDGALWVTTDYSVAALRGGQWTLASKQSARGIAIGADGTAWAGSGSSIVGLRLDGSPPRRVACPNGSWSMAATTDGSIYVGDWAWLGHPGLARFDGRTCERVDPLGDGMDVEVGELHADPTGGLVAVFSGPGNPDGSGPATIYLARLDGTRWTVLEESDVWPLGVSLSPSGEIWRAGASAVLPTWERFDGERWIPVDTGDAALGPPSIAADGTLWFLGPSGVYRVSMEEARP